MDQIQHNVIIEDIDYTWKKSFRLFWYAFFFFTIISLFSAYKIIGPFLLNVGKLFSVTVMFFAFIQNIKVKFDSRIFKWLFIIYIIWQFIVIARGFSFSYDTLVLMVADNEYAYYAVIPFIIFLFSDSLYNYKYLIKYLIRLDYVFFILLFLIITSVISIGYKYNADYLVIYLSIPVGFLLLIFPYLNSYQKKVAIITFIVSLLFCMIYARRNLIFSLLGFLSMACFLYYTYHLKRNINKKLILIILSIFILCLAYFAYISFRDTIFSTLDQRLTANTREIVTLLFIEDMDPQDWVIGKGMDGQYYAPGFDDYSSTDYRRGIETGLLTVVLKGGFVSLILFWLIAFYAIYKGYFKTNNGFTKGAALLIFFWLIEMYPSGQSAFNIRYLMVWICIGICVSAQLRSIPDKELKEFLLKD